MEVNGINRTSFGAKIIPSAELNKALELAKKDASSGTIEGLERAGKFYNSLRTIERECEGQEFFVKTGQKRFYPHVKLGGVIRLLEFFGRMENNIAMSVQDAVNKLVESKFFRGEVKDEAKNTDLVKAFDRWMTK